MLCKPIKTKDGLFLVLWMDGWMGLDQHIPNITELSEGKIRVSGGFIDITCVTSGDIDAMDCRWKKDEWTKLQFKYK